MVFKDFFEVISTNTHVISLPKESYVKLPEIKQRFNLDFDDAYQFQAARDLNLAIVTIDKDFNRVRGEIKVIPIASS
jgi:predicted nucleic acid-binding protein